MPTGRVLCDVEADRYALARQAAAPDNRAGMQPREDIRFAPTCHFFLPSGSTVVSTLLGSCQPAANRPQSSAGTSYLSPAAQAADQAKVRSATEMRQRPRTFVSVPIER